MLLAWGGGGSGGRRKCQFMEILWISSTVILLTEEEPGQASLIVGRIACVGIDSIIWIIKKWIKWSLYSCPSIKLRPFYLNPEVGTESLYIYAFMLTYENGVWRGEIGQSCTLGFIFRIQGMNSNSFYASTQARGVPFSLVLFHKSSETSLFNITILE